MSLINIYRQDNPRKSKAIPRATMSLTGTKLAQQVLPEYTTERYYVLSEIEQAARFESAEGGDTEGGEETVEEGEKKHFYYMLWNLHTDGITKFQEDVTALCGHLRIEGRSNNDSAGVPENEDEPFFAKAKTFLSVEVVMSRDAQTQLAQALDIVSSSSPGSAKKDLGPHPLQQAHEFLRQNFALDMVAFGVCDKLAGTPAIELLQQMVCLTYADLPPTAKLLHALTIDTYLGHDAEREPDAESGATQSLFLSRPYSPPPRKESRIDFSAQPPYFHAVAFGFVAASVLMLAALCYGRVTNPELAPKEGEDPEF